MVKEKYQLIPTGYIDHNWINHPLTGGTNTRWVSQLTCDCHYIEKPPKFYPKRTEKPVFLAVFLKKQGWLDINFSGKNADGDFQKTLTHLTFDIPEKLPSEKGKEVVFQLRLFQWQTCLKKLQRCMIWISCFIGYFLFGFFPCFWAPGILFGGKNQGETHRLADFCWRGATVS